MLFEGLKQFDRIYVTGPQRAGTTICSQMIAHDTGYQYVDELSFGAENYELFDRLKNKKHCVIHCPGFCHLIHEYTNDDTLIVLVRRPIEEIVRSQKRATWRGECNELEKYGLTKGVMSMIKYKHFDKHQRHLIKHLREVDYHSLEPHPMWCDNRGQFTKRQTCHQQITVCRRFPPSHQQQRETRSRYRRVFGYRYYPHRRFKEALQDVGWVYYLLKESHQVHKIEDHLQTGHKVIVLDETAILFRCCQWCVDLIEVMSVPQVLERALAGGFSKERVKLLGQ